jgi:hypothetical protein
MKQMSVNGGAKALRTAPSPHQEPLVAPTAPPRYRLPCSCVHQAPQFKYPHLTHYTQNVCINNGAVMSLQRGDNKSPFPEPVFSYTDDVATL